MQRQRLGWCLVGLLVSLGIGCSSDEPAVDRVGVNVVDKTIFEGSWYYSRTVIDVDYEGSGLGTFEGDAASDLEGGLTALPRVRWVIDEDHLIAYRDYDMVEGIDGNDTDDLGLPVAAFEIEKHFDIRRAYNTSTGEEQNVVVENDTDRRWYDRQFMRVNWSRNELSQFYGQTYNLYEVFGLWKRESADLFVQEQSEFPDSWRPRFHRMPAECQGATAPSGACPASHFDLAADYDADELYHFSFVTQELLSPGELPDPVSGAPTNWCYSAYSDAPECTTVAAYVRNSFLKVSDSRQYEPTNWVDTRFERAGYFRNERPTYDRSTDALDPAYFATDFRNYNINRHNIWKNWWRDEGGAKRPVPYAEREVRQIVWHTTPELPAHLVKPSFELVSEWNRVLMSTVRTLRGQGDAEYPRLACQEADPDAYCFCTRNEAGQVILPDTDGDGIGDCAGRYDPFKTKAESEAAGAVNAYDCHVELPESARAELLDPAGILNRPDLRDADFNPWFEAQMVGAECVNVLRINTCNRASLAAEGGSELDCEERGDMRFKFLSYVDQPGTAFLGIATMRGDPVTGEILAGDANIGGPALDGYRTTALQTYDLVNGHISEQEFYTGEDVRAYMENLGRVQLPAPPRIDFSVALAAGHARADDLASIDRQMAKAMTRVDRLHGPEARAQVFSDRRSLLRNSEFEQLILGGPDALIGAGAVRLPSQAVLGGQVPKAVLDRVSPFRADAADDLAKVTEMESKLSKAGVELPNEYTDWSVTSFAQRHSDWPRARLEFSINRLLYYETQLHEMGHCMGLRHQFGASADENNYFDDYFHINRQIPLPDPTTFDEDGTPGLSAAEQRAWDDAYTSARKQRELAGVDLYMNSSVMEYTGQWYERITSRAGRYDEGAIAFGYGDVVPVYDNRVAQVPRDRVDPTNVPRTYMRYYQGGEACSVDAECPLAADGTRATDLLATNLEAGVTQTCDVVRRSCSNFDEDFARVVGTTATPAYVPITYRFCSDERVGTLGWCHRFDEGNNYREMVRNVAEDYERSYLFQAFRRYRRNFGVGTYAGRLIDRQFTILQDVLHNMLYRYVSDPSYRTDEGEFGFYDQFLASADTLNFYARVLGQPSIGSYEWDDGWKRYEAVSTDVNEPGSDVSVPIGLGRYLSTRYQAGLSGIQRVERVGSYYDKIIAMQMLTLRGQRPAYGIEVNFLVNFYDLFPLEMQQIFSGMIRGTPEEYTPRVQCDRGTFPTCEQPRIVYMDFYRGDCSRPETCRPDPVRETYRDFPVIAAGDYFTLRLLASQYAMLEFPVYFDTSFQNQMFICIQGSGSCHAPSADSVEGQDFVRYTSTRYGRTFLAWEVEPSRTVQNQESLGFKMIEEAKNLDFTLRMLEKARVDRASLTDVEQAELNRIGYAIPTAVAQIDSEIGRIDGRIYELESFFNQIIYFSQLLGF